MEAATRILARAVRMQDAIADVTPIPKASDAPSANGVNSAVAQEMGSVNQRLFNNLYFRSVDALLLLGATGSPRSSNGCHGLPDLRWQQRPMGGLCG